MSGRDGRVEEAARHGRRRERAVEHVYVVVGEVGGVEPVAAGVGADGEARVDVARIADDVLGRRALRAVPGRDVAGDRVEDEEGGCRSAAARRGDLEVAGRVADRARGQAARYGNGLRAWVEYDGRAAHVAAHELRRARPVVDDPEGACAPHRDAPTVDEKRVEQGREAGDVGDEVRLTVSRPRRDDRNLRAAVLALLGRGRSGDAHARRCRQERESEQQRQRDAENFSCTK